MLCIIEAGGMWGNLSKGSFMYVVICDTALYMYYIGYTIWYLFDI